MFEDAMYLPAEWVIVGCRLEGTGWERYGRVMVLGSNELSRAELRTEVEELELFAPLLSYLPRRTITFSTVVGRYVLCFGDSYRQALERLMKSWSPPERFAEGPVLQSGDTASIEAAPIMLGP